MTSFTAADAARILGGLAWLGDDLFARFGRWSADGLDAVSAPQLASLSRRLGEHAAWWRAQIPESVLLAADVQDGPVNSGVAELVAAFDGVDPADRLIVAAAVVEALTADLTILAGRLNPVGDAAVARTLRLVLADLIDRPAVAAPAPEPIRGLLESARPVTG